MFFFCRINEDVLLKRTKSFVPIIDNEKAKGIKFASEAVAEEFVGHIGKILFGAEECETLKRGASMQSLANADY